MAPIILVPGSKKVQTSSSTKASKAPTLITQSPADSVFNTQTQIRQNTSSNLRRKTTKQSENESRKSKTSPAAGN